jgi:hypothetical protein
MLLHSKRIYLSLLVDWKFFIGHKAYCCLSCNGRVISGDRRSGRERERGKIFIMWWGCRLLLLVSLLVCSWTLKMEAICSSETLISFRTIRFYNPEDRCAQDISSIRYGRKDPSRWPLGTLYPQKLTLNFADKRRSLGRYSSLADSGHGVCLFL